MAERSAIVVGAGVFGAAAADSLARRGWEVWVFDQYAPANARGSSGDRTRLLRVGHGDSPEDEWYMRSALRARDLWADLSSSQDTPLFERTGLAWFECERGDGVAKAAAGLERLGVQHEWFDPQDARALFPDLGIDDITRVLFEPDAAIIRATAAVESLVRRAKSHGAAFMAERARPAGPRTIELHGRGEHEADVVIWACGAWLGGLFPDEAPVRATWQDVLHWLSPPAWRDGPAWFDEAAGLYGFPDIDGLGIKALSHEPGRQFDIENEARVADAAAIDALSQYIARRFPALAGTGVVSARVMPYEMTPDHHFVIGRSERFEGHWLLGGGSGHGFKHAPALGEYLADLIEEDGDPEPWLTPGPR